MKNEIKNLFRCAVIGGAMTLLAGGVAQAQEEGDRPERPRGDRPGRGPSPELLERFDANGDGQLSDEERAVAREARGQRGDRTRGFRRGLGMADIDVRALREAADKDGDGDLNEEERNALRDAITKAHEEALAKIVKEFDKDGDGSLNEEEAAAAREAAAAKREAERLAAEKARIEKFDKDGDGALNDAEKVAAFTADLAENERRAQFTVRRYDEDGDGSLSDAEKLAAVKDLEERRNRFNRRGEGRRGPNAEGDRPRRSPEAQGARPRGSREGDAPRPRPNRGGGDA